MEDPIQALGSHPLQHVKLSFLNTSVLPSVLARRLVRLSASPTVSDLHSRIVESLQKLSSLNAFRACNVLVKPGDQADSALVEFDLEDLSWWSLTLGLLSNNEGGKAVLSSGVRNIRQKCDLTQLRWAFKPHTRTFGFEILHEDQLYSEGLEAKYFYSSDSTELDQSLREHAYGAGVSFATRDSKHTWALRRFIRTNSLDLAAASAETVRTHLGVSAKTAFTHVYRARQTLQGESWKLKSVYSVTNEAAVEDVQFHRLEAAQDSILQLKNSDVILQLTSKLGLILPLFGTQRSFANDLYRSRYVKGFKSLGCRLPSESIGSYGVEGDNLGSECFAGAEVKAHFSSVPWLSSIDLVPFMYVNSFLPTTFPQLLRADLKDHIRASCGFGIAWSSPFGRIEASYAAFTLSRKGDVPATFQVLLSS
jgi:hypothetical protein